MKRKMIGFFLLLMIIISVHWWIDGKEERVQNIVEDSVEVVIDPGHGGDDPGKVGVGSVLEKDINLGVALKVTEILEEKNISAGITREVDTSLGDQSGNYKRVTDLKARVTFINQLKPKLAVSIHQNSYGDSSIRGAQIFYYSKSEKGSEAARIMQDMFLKLQPENHRKIKGNDSYYMLRRTSVPTIIVESGFLTNRDEATKLASEEYQEKVAMCIANGIEEYLHR